MKEFVCVMEAFHVFIEMVVTALYAFVKNMQNSTLKRLNFPVSILYLNKNNEKKGVGWMW